MNTTTRPGFAINLRPRRLTRAERRRLKIAEAYRRTLVQPLKG